MNNQLIIFIFHTSFCNPVLIQPQMFRILFGKNMQQRNYWGWIYCNQIWFYGLHVLWKKLRTWKHSNRLCRCAAGDFDKEPPALLRISREHLLWHRSKEISEDKVKKSWKLDHFWNAEICIAMSCLLIQFCLDFQKIQHLGRYVPIPKFFILQYRNVFGIQTKSIRLRKSLQE